MFLTLLGVEEAESLEEGVWDRSALLAVFMWGDSFLIADGEIGSWKREIWGEEEAIKCGFTVLVD